MQSQQLVGKNIKKSVLSSKLTVCCQIFLQISKVLLGDFGLIFKTKPEVPLNIL